MARRRKPESANLVDFVFGFKEKALRRKPTRTEVRRLDLGGGIESVIQDDMQNLLYATAIDTPTAAVTSAINYNVKNAGLSRGLQNLINSANNGFKKNYNGKDYFIDPVTGNLMEDNTTFLKDTSGDVVNIAHLDQEMALNAADPTEASVKNYFLRNRFKRIKDAIEPLPGGQAGKMAFEIFEQSSRFKKDPLAAVGYIRNQLYKRGGSMRKLGSLTALSRDRFASLGASTANIEDVMKKNFEKVVNPVVLASYDTGKFASHSASVINARDKDKALHLIDSANQTGTLQDWLKSSNAEQRAIAQSVKDYLLEFKPGLSIGSDFGLTLAYMQSFPFIANILTENPTKNLGNLVYQFGLTNQGWSKLANNQFLVRMALKYPNSNWANLLNTVTTFRNNHPLNFLSNKFLAPVGEAIGRAVSKLVGEILVKTGLKSAVMAATQALGSLAPVVGNIIALVATELVFKIAEPVLKFIGEMIKLAFWVIFIIILIGIWGSFSLLGGLSPEFTLPQGGGERPLLEDSDVAEIPLIDGTAPGRVFPGACPILGGLSCMQGPDGGFSHADMRTQAIDLRNGGGQPLKSPCTGTVSSWGDWGCDGGTGTYMWITCSTGHRVRMGHASNRAGNGSSVVAGQQVATTPSGHDDNCYDGTHLHFDCMAPGGGFMDAGECLTELGCSFESSSCAGEH
jgi:hypothetical protein